MRVVDGVTELIGQTPMIRLSRLFGHLPAQLWGKRPRSADPLAKER